METVKSCQLSQAGIAQPVLLTVGTRAGGLGVYVWNKRGGGGGGGIENTAGMLFISSVMGVL